MWRPGSLLILDDQPLPWRPRALNELTVEDFLPIVAAGTRVAEFVLLGAGEMQAPPPREIREALRRAGLGLEFMSTARAAQVWGVLVAEGRRPAAALIAI